MEEHIIYSLPNLRSLAKGSIPILFFLEQGQALRGEGQGYWSDGCAAQPLAASAACESLGFRGWFDRGVGGISTDPAP